MVSEQNLFFAKEVTVKASCIQLLLVFSLMVIKCAHSIEYDASGMYYSLVPPDFLTATAQDEHERLTFMVHAPPEVSIGTILPPQPGGYLSTGMVIVDTNIVAPPNVMRDPPPPYPHVEQPMVPQVYLWQANREEGAPADCNCIPY